MHTTQSLVSVERKSTLPTQGEEAKLTVTTGDTLFKPKSPEYTIRMLLEQINTESKDIPKLKPYSHFTLGCTYEDEASKIRIAFEKLNDYFKNSVTFKPEAVINLGSESQPLWALSLNLGSKDTEIRAFLSELFDSVMSPERNGVLYLWKPNESSQKKCPHLTIGPKKEDLEVAKELLRLNCDFIFNQFDYKKVGPHDSHVSKKLGDERGVTNLIVSNANSG